MKCSKCDKEMKLYDTILDKNVDVLLTVNIYKCDCGNTDIEEYDDD